MQVWAKQRRAGSQLTLEQLSMGKLHLFSEEELGVCSAGHALIRHFFQEIKAGAADYQLSWRQQNVPMVVGSIDAHMKRGSALSDLHIKQTVWSNDAGCPTISIFTNSASMDDPAFSAACEEYRAVVAKTGMCDAKVLYLDNVSRDAGGAGRRFPSVMTSLRAKEHSCVSDISKAHCVAGASDVAAACAVFENAEVLGFDLEWKAHATGSTGPRGKVATLQLSDGLGNVALFHLTSLRGVPPALASLLAKARLAGVGVGNDLKKLNQDYGVAIPPNVVELRTLATDVLRCAANKVGSLEAVFSQCCPGRVLNKKLCHHGGPRFVNWEKWPLEQHETMYALNDADAGALAARRLLFPQQLQQPAAVPTQLPQVPADHASTGATAFASIDQSITNGLCAGGDADDDDDVDDADEEAAAADDNGDDGCASATHKTVVQAARRLVDLWVRSGDTDRLKLPSFLTSDDRAELHAYCESLGLVHETVQNTSGTESERHLVISRRADAASSQGAGYSDDRIFARLKFNELWSELCVKYDPRHFLGNWFLMAQSKSSSIFKYFCCASSDAMFPVAEGERERNKRHLRKLFREGDGEEERKRVDALVARVRRPYWRRRCRTTIPPPRELARRLYRVYLFFKDIDDPETGRPFFSGGHEARCRHELEYVAAGWVSDHPDVPLYVPSRVMATTGHQLYDCLRSSSPLEGYHQHLEHAVSRCGKHAGLRYTEAHAIEQRGPHRVLLITSPQQAVTNEFDWRWCVRALRKRGIIPRWVRS